MNLPSSNSSVMSIKFYRGWYQTSQNTSGRHYHVTSQNLAFKIAHFVELTRSYQSSKFIDLGCLDQILRGMMKNTPPQNYTFSKSPVLIGVNTIWSGGMAP